MMQMMSERLDERDQQIEQLIEEKAHLTVALEKKTEAIETLQMRCAFLAATLRGVEDGLSIKEAKDKACEKMGIDNIESKQI